MISSSTPPPWRCIVHKNLTISDVKKWQISREKSRKTCPEKPTKEFKSITPAFSAVCYQFICNLIFGAEKP